MANINLIAMIKFSFANNIKNHQSQEQYSTDSHLTMDVLMWASVGACMYMSPDSEI